jgi:mannose-1-phosphate guanylyltransferase/mannose-6-phosphate isomerase
VAPPLVVGNEEHRFLVLDQLREMPASTRRPCCSSPVGRNTAPAVTLAALQALAWRRDPVLVVTPADQTVTDGPAFTTAMRARRAVPPRAAASPSWASCPTAPRPATATSAPRRPAMAKRRVERFVEKPDLATAERYLAEGGYFWNAGMFVLRASVWMAALERFRPDIAAACRAALGAALDRCRLRAPGQGRVRRRAVRIGRLRGDGALPGQRHRHPHGASWPPAGTTSAPGRPSGRWPTKDGQGNASVRRRCIVSDSRNTLVHATSRLVGAVGLDDVVVVETPDAVLVADRERSQDVKKIVAAARAANSAASRSCTARCTAPGAGTTASTSGPRHQVKRILVKPGASPEPADAPPPRRALDRGQRHRRGHQRRQGHPAGENQSTYIPLGQTHRLANPGKVPLEIIEVQSGSYLGEDDIVRFEDTYGRGASGPAMRGRARHT